ncbi:MAG: CoA transferase, partial [Gammaproteobacteria bacterium]|nr:CoA transferase [Gammaproteobacteria bacterium]
TIIIAVIGDKFWPALVNLVNVDELRDPDFATAHQRLAAKDFIEGKLNEILRRETADYWLQRLEAARIPCARVNNLAQALSDPQVRYREMVVPLAHPQGGTAEVPGNPIKLSGTGKETYAPPPLLGAHTREVFEQWTQLDKQAIDEAIAAGHIAQATQTNTD